MNRPSTSARQAAPRGRDPWVIVREPSLGPAAKLRLLRQLEFDARQVLVASEEGMDGPAPHPSLSEILAAIAWIEPEAPATSSPTKM